MADARREHDFDVAISTICYLGASFHGKFRPQSANPYRREEDRVLSAEERKDESDEGWAILKAGIAQLAGARG